jgi:SAM-dependent methyltransferase
MEMFRSLCAQFYSLEQPATLPPSIDFYLQKADQLGGPVLEPMCGSGRYLIPLAEKGIDITGTDASKHMLAACREKCTDSGLEVTLVKELVQNTRLPGGYALIFIPSGSLGLLADDKELCRVVKNLYRLLKRGGKLIFEVPMAKSNTADEARMETKEVGDDDKIISLTTQPVYDKKTRVMSTTYTYEALYDTGETLEEIEVLHQKYFLEDELESILITSGFKSFSYYEPYTDGTKAKDAVCLVYECTK